MRRRAILVSLSFAIVTGIGSPAVADEIAHCWYEDIEGINLLICRLADSEIVVYRERTEVPETLYPAVGLDSSGTCWFYRTVFTGWIAVAVINGETLFYYDPDGIPGGPVIADASYRPCDDEPVDIVTIEELVWDVVEAFPFDDPDPDLQPAVGVTGLPTFVALAPPATVTELVTSPGSTIDVRFTVALVTIDWGDNNLTDLTPSLYGLLAGYPDGDVTHSYETKDFYATEIAYEWDVDWRVNGGAWRDVVGIDPTTWTTTYEVHELVTRVTG